MNHDCAKGEHQGLAGEPCACCGEPLCPECGMAIADHTTAESDDCRASATYDPAEDSYDARRERRAGDWLR